MSSGRDVAALLGLRCLTWSGNALADRVRQGPTQLCRVLRRKLCPGNGAPPSPGALEEHLSGQFPMTVPPAAFLADAFQCHVREDGCRLEDPEVPLPWRPGAIPERAQIYT